MDPTTGAPAPQAYVKVDDASLKLAIDSVSITANAYYNKAARDSGLSPIYSYQPFVLSVDEINQVNPAFVSALATLVQAGKIASPRDALMACLYVMLKQRSDFSMAIDV